MDTNALYPRCPYCGLPMQFKGGSPNFFALQAYECRACDVVLGIAAQAEILESSAPTLGLRRDYSERKSSFNASQVKAQ